MHIWSQLDEFRTVVHGIGDVELPVTGGFRHVPPVFGYLQLFKPQLTCPMSKVVNIGGSQLRTDAGNALFHLLPQPLRNQVVEPKRGLCAHGHAGTGVGTGTGMGMTDSICDT